MYLAVLAVIVGQALLLRQVSLLIYGAVVASAFFTFVKLYEERALLSATARRIAGMGVPGWIPPRRRWRVKRR